MDKIKPKYIVETDLPELSGGGGDVGDSGSSAMKAGELKPNIIPARWEPEETIESKGVDYLNETKEIMVGAGSYLFRANSQGIWLGAKTFATAPFSVDMQGNAVVRSLRRNDFHWFTFFETIDGYVQKLQGAASVINLGTSVTLTSGTTQYDYASLDKSVTYYSSSFSWDKKRSFKTGIKLSSTSNIRASIGTGYICEESNGTALNEARIAFRFDAGKIYGYVAGGSAATSLDCGNHTTDSYTLEAIFIPGVSVEFFINGTSAGTITTNLPSGSTEASFVFGAYVESRSTDAKELFVSFFDFWQEAV